MQSQRLSGRQGSAADGVFFLRVAGLALGVAPVHECNPEDTVKMINTNVTAVAILTRIFAEGMKQRNRGHIGRTTSNL